MAKVTPNPNGFTVAVPIDELLNSKLSISGEDTGYILLARAVVKKLPDKWKEAAAASQAVKVSFDNKGMVFKIEYYKELV